MLKPIALKARPERSRRGARWVLKGGSGSHVTFLPDHLIALRKTPNATAVLPTHRPINGRSSTSHFPQISSTRNMAVTFVN
jgi:hypothetical protein